MKLIQILALATAMGTVAAPQTPANGKPQTANTAGQPIVTKTGAVQTGAKKKTVPANPAVSPKTKKTSAPLTQSGTTNKVAKKEKKPKVVAKKSTSGAVPATEGGLEPLSGQRGRRDPFLSPLRSVNPGGSGPAGPPCSTGKRCLSIPELTFQGTIKDTSGKMIALVVTASRRLYTLRENDQIYNGSVEKITSDSVTFRENGTDKFGHPTSHEVTKKLNPSS